MLIPWNTFDPVLPLRRDLRRQFQQIFDSLETGIETAGSYRGYPALNVLDDGEQFSVVAAVPGLGEGDVDVSIHDNVLTIRGERKVEYPQDYKLHKQERESYRFSRSVNMPVLVEAEKATAQVANGLLTVTLPKAPEVKPRVIKVKPA